MSVPLIKKQNNLTISRQEEELRDDHKARVQAIIQKLTGKFKLTESENAVLKMAEAAQRRLNGQGKSEWADDFADKNPAKFNQHQCMQQRHYFGHIHRDSEKELGKMARDDAYLTPEEIAERAEAALREQEEKAKEKKRAEDAIRRREERKARLRGEA